MKKIILILGLLLTGCTATNKVTIREDTKKEGEPRKSLGENMATTTFTMDLSVPELSASNGHQLELPTKKLLVFKLKNANPYRYTYILKHKKVDFFQENEDVFKPKADPNPSKVDLDTSAKRDNGYKIQAPFAASLLAKGGKEVSAKNEKEDAENVIKAADLIIEEVEKLHNSIQLYLKEVSGGEVLFHEKFKEVRRDFFNKQLQLLSHLKKLNFEAKKLKIEEVYQLKVEEFTVVSDVVKEEINRMFAVTLEYYTLPIDINGKNIDLVEVNLERRKIGETETHDLHHYNIWIKGGFKFDVSGGIFLSSLMDAEYETQQIEVMADDGTTATRSVIYEKDLGNYKYGLGSTINMSWRNGSSWWKPTLSLGALFSAEQKFQILAGGGMVLGKEKRVVLQAGWSLGQVSVISDRYEADGTTPYDLGSAGDIPTTTKFLTGHFFGITYNLGEVKTADDED